MSISLLSKIQYRLRKQGPFALLCIGLIKVGEFLQRLGKDFDRRMSEVLPTHALNNAPHGFGGILDVIRESYLPPSEVAPQPAEVPMDVVAWIVPHFLKGSGGHTTLFRFICGLEKLGVKNKVYILNDMQALLSPTTLKRQIGEYFFPLQGEVEVISAPNLARKADMVICTSWQTAYVARTWIARRKIYFVQDYEPFFSPVGSYYHFAEATYRMGFEFFTAGPWLLQTLKTKFAAKGDSFYLCPDRSIYYPRTTFSLSPLLEHRADTDMKNTFRIGLYNRSATPRRCVEIVWIALSILAETDKRFIVFSFGDEEKPKLPFPHVNLGLLNHDELAQVYSFCDIIIAPSATNLSLLAREVMACSGVVVDLKGENTALELKDQVNSLLVEPDVAAFLKIISDLIDQPELIRLMRERIEADMSTLPEWVAQIKKLRQFIGAAPALATTTEIKSWPTR
jgi:glycosyltransferase involved in cell wall biosynthesis